MKIVMFSMTPLFAEKSMGGAQKQLKKIALHLVEEGHDITILCTRRPDASHPFNWHERAQIIPIFRFKQPYPEPYFTPVYNIANAIQDLGEYLQRADRYYSHDGGLIFPYIYQDVPTIISLRSILFAETLQSGFLFQGHKLILPSEHTQQAYLHTVGRFFPDLEARTQVIHNGFDWDKYKPTRPTDELKKIIPFADNHDYILYPHRPEEAKGIYQAIDVLDKLVNRYRQHQVKLLAPKWLDASVAPELKAFYQQLEDTIAQRGLTDHVIFHDWINDTLITQYYSLGTVTLALGSYVETFGNTIHESLGCGTPVIMSRVGPYRDLIPDAEKVAYGDTESAAAIAYDIIRKKERTPAHLREYLIEHFSLKGMVETFAEAILNAEKPTPLRYEFQAIDDDTKFQLAPWCDFSHHLGVYHDFRAEYNADEALMKLISSYHDDATFSRARVLGISRETVMNWYRAGYLLPIRG